MRKLLFGFIVILVYLCGCGQSQPKSKVIVFHAGSLALPLAKMEEEFEQKYSEIDIVREAAGSQQCVRKITDLKKTCDIMLSADYRIIDTFLIPSYAQWNILFASNEMVIAYTQKSSYAHQIDKTNWYEILAKPEVVWGHADPNLDPCGYRALLVLKLAELYYVQPGLYARLLNNCPPGNLRPKSVELISLLQSGNMDYAWEYRSVAVQHGLEVVELPEDINLSNPKHNDFYAQAKIEINGAIPGRTITIQGNAITYGATILQNAPHPKEAVWFFKYLLSSQGGLNVLKQMGQTPFVAPFLETKEMLEKVPEELKSYIVLSPKGLQK
jgi:molybdate/tungstate transport system substrate-binding protein